MTSTKPDIWIEKKALEYKFASGINTTTVKQANKTDLVPLYTHPAKELTDEEKWEIFTHLARSPDLRTDMIRFADSILRKAQEK